MEGGTRFGRVDLALGGGWRLQRRPPTFLLSGVGALTSLIFLLALLSPTAAAAECTDTWTGAAEGTWQTAANWSTGKAPTSADVACIGSGKTANVSAGTNAVGIVQGEGKLRISGGSLEVVTAPSEETPHISSFEQSGGALKGAGTLYISKSLSWIGGTMEGSGSTVLQSEASGTISSEVTLAKRLLTNNGSVIIPSASRLTEKEGAEVQNVGTFIDNSQYEPTIWNGGGTAPKFANTGTFKKTSGTGKTEIGVNFENKSLVQALTGTLSFANGGSSNASGEWKASEGASVKYTGGTFSLTGSTWTGAGTIAVAGAAVTSEELHTSGLTVASGSLSIASGSLTVSSFTESGGAIAGAGTLNVSGSLTWSGGHMEGSGSTVLESGASGTVSGALNTQLIKRSLVNAGTITLPAFTRLEMKEGAELKNTGTIVDNSQYLPSILNAGGSAPSLVNTGTLKTEVGSESAESSIGVNITNQGEIDSIVGALSFTGGGSSTGKWVAAEKASITFPKGLLVLTSGSLSGRFHISGGAILLAEGVKAEGVELSVSDTGTSLSVTKGSISVLSLSQSGGSVGGAGTLNVSGSLTWSGGHMEGSGSTVLQSGGTGTISGSPQLITRSLVNEGTTKLAAKTRLEMKEGAEVRNPGTFISNSEYEPAISNAGGAAPSFTNSGAVKKTEGSGTSLIDVNFSNYGTVDSKVKITHPVSAGFRQHFEKECNAGEPVDCATGDYTETQTDFAIGGRGVGLDLTRSYSAKAAATASSPGAFGYGWSNSFSDRLVSEESGKKITLFTGSGSSVPFTGGPGTFTAPTWSQDTLSGSAEAGYTLTLPEQTKYAFNGSGRLESVTDPNGNKTTLAYNKSGQLEAITDPAGRQITLAYNGEGLVESAKDPIGNTVKYAYEAKNLKSVTEPGEASPRWQFKYDASHRITLVTDGRGGKTTNEYDSSNRVISQTDPAGHTLSLEYEAFHTKITNKSTGSITDEWFTSNHEPVSVTRGYGTPEASTETFSYDAAGRLVGATDGKGHTTTYGYNGQGDRTSEKDAEGNETKWAFNAAHQVTSTTTPRDETTTIERDANGNPETISRPGPEETTQTTAFEYDEHGQLESVTDPLERTWAYGYNSQGDRTSEADPLGNTQTLDYDKDSRLTSIVTPRGNVEGAEAAEYTTTIERDPLGRPLKATDPLGHTVKYAYDGNGNLEAKTDANGHMTKYAYNADNEQIEVEKPNGAILKTEYDGEGNVTNQTDANKRTTTYVRNALGQPIEVIDPLGRKTLEEFDAAGNLKAMIDPAERKTSYAYDAADRLTEVSYSDGATPNAKFEYDADGNVTKMVDGTGESTFGYDQLGRLTESEDGHGDFVGYGYDLAEQLTGIAYPNGKSISRSFDKAGRLESVTDWLGGTTTFAYDADSNLEAITFPTVTSNVDEYAYDHADRMSAAKFASGPETLASLAYLRDPVGQVEEEASSGLPGAAKIAYGYDENERLVEAGEASFEYDPADNLTKAPGTTNTYDAASQLEAGTGVTYTYDKLYERTKATPEAGPATTYGYDQAGNLISIERPEKGEVPAIEESLAYDATGLLASKTDGMTTHYLTWDNSASLPLLLSDGENSYIYGPNGLPTEEISGEETSTYLHHDQLGSTRLLTNTAGEDVGAFSYAPFGALEASTGTASTPLGFTGQYTDQQTGLQYLRARFYDSATAQFLTKDPLTAVLRSPYGYAGENPLRYVDPSGMSCVGVGHYGPGIPFPTVDPVDCASDLGDGAGEATKAGGEALGFAADKASLLIPPVVFAACLVEEDWCTPAVITGSAGAVGANGYRSLNEPCFNFLSGSIRDLIVNLAAALPGGMFAATAGRAGPELGPIARRIIQVVLDVPGLAAELIHGAAAH